MGRTIRTWSDSRGEPDLLLRRRSPVALTLVAAVAVLLLAGSALAIQSGSINLTGNPLGANGPKASHEPDASEGPEASEGPDESEGVEEPDGSEGPPSAEELARVVDKLKAVGITATASDLADLSAKVGLGGAVRVYAFAHASGKTPAEILAMFQGGKGWGEIKHELNLSIGPGIGWIMGNGGGTDKEKDGPEPSGG
jgi:hypothetical protein